jgi:hypothetical protein
LGSVHRQRQQPLVGKLGAGVLTAEQPSVEALVERVRSALNRGAYSPEAAGWQAFFDATTRDEALAALDSLTAALERQRETTQRWYDEAHEQRRSAAQAEARAQKAEAERDNWHASNYAERQARLRAEAVVEAARGIIGSKESQSPWGQDVLNALARYDEPPTHPYYAERVAAGLPTSACPRCGVTDGYHAKDCSVDEPPTEQI